MNSSSNTPKTVKKDKENTPGGGTRGRGNPYFFFHACFEKGFNNKNLEIQRRVRFD